ncbi:MAG: hypothetical protein QXH80_04725 [Candidatus Nanoarchaeia archaeon]
MTRQQISDLVYWLLRQVSTNTDISPSSDMVTIINAAYNQVMADLLPDTMMASQVVPVRITTLVSGSGTTITVANATYIAANTWIVVHDSSRFEIARVLSKNTNTLTLRSPGIIKTFAAGSSVVPVSFVITAPREIKVAAFRHIDTTHHDLYILRPITDTESYEQCFCPTYSSNPVNYALLSPTEVFIYPVPQYNGYLEFYYVENVEYSLADANAVPVLAVQFHPLIVLWALMLCYSRYREWKEATAVLQLYNVLLESYRNELNRKYASSAPLDKPRLIV